ncbi:MAG: hypothetical protein P9L92_15460 [Candidatus Electryonea clarkiae]|nr:hypothetical protein [Candidatus Electryonea clarkiae]MDP8288220.1 hypothetical protein [Candidatus Electryonea clarkiae]
MIFFEISAGAIQYRTYAAEITNGDGEFTWVDPADPGIVQVAAEVNHTIHHFLWEH